MPDTLLALLPHKLRAASIHFLISLGLFAVLMYLILGHWYPMPWFPIDGGWQGTRIMVGVDLVLGPLLTFIIFNPFKSRREIMLDLGLIALIQAGALAWGIHLVHGQRPLAIVYWNGSFHSVDRKSPGFRDFPPEGLSAFGEQRPVVVYQAEPDNEQKKVEMAMAIFGNDQPEHEHPELWRPLTAHLEQIKAESLDVAEMRRRAPDVAQTLDRLLQHHDQDPAQAYLVPFDGRYQAATLVMTADGSILGYLPAMRLPRRQTGPLPETPAGTSGGHAG
jgi:hypothetical protein